MAKRAVVGAGVVLLLAAGAALLASGPQQSPPAAPPAQTFHSSTVVVQVDAIVTDGKGRFVSDLTPDDFEVLENGKPQTIQTVYRVEGASVSPVRRTGAAMPEAAPPAVMAPPRADQRVFVFFFDQEHLSQGPFTRLQRAAEDYLKTAFRQGDVGGVLMGGTMVGNRLTGDRDELARDLEGAKIGSGLTSLRRDLQDWPRMSEIEALRIALQSDQGLLDQVVRRALDEAPAGRQFDPEGAVLNKARAVADRLLDGAKKTLTTLEALASGLGRVPGRKTIVMLSEGFYLDQATSQLRQIVATAARSNVRLYAIDARGLDRTPEGSALTSISPLETGNHISTTAYDTIGDGTNSLAVDTGGFVVRNTNAFEEALAEIANDTSHYYVIGYSPTDATMDGAFRQITVRVKRQGVKVRARKGYLATADAVPAATMVASETSAVPAAESAGAAPAAAPAPAESAPTEPAPAPAPETPAAPASTAATAPVPTTPATAAPAPAPAAGAPGVTLRPDAAARVRKLAGGEEESGEGKDLASQGWDRYGRGDLEGAEKLLGQAARLPGAAPWVSYALGFAQLGLNRPEAAVRSWVRVRTAAPEFESVYFDLADAYTRLHDPDRAVAVLRLAEARWPKDAEVLNAIGTIQVRRGALDAALKSFQKAADTQPDAALAHFNLGRTYELRYYRTRRYSNAAGRWFDNPDDMKRALEEYRAYLKIGGPYEDQARAAIERLKWAGAIK